jgi:allantoate deiminase
LAGIVDANKVLECCQAISKFTEEPGRTTRTFLSPPMTQVHDLLRAWMRRLGMSSWIDPAGNLRGIYSALDADSPRLLIGSHLDTVPSAGPYDGVLGVVLAIALIEGLGGRRLPFALEVLGFSDEEGVRFGAPFLGSKALIGSLSQELLEKKDAAGISVAQAIKNFGLDPRAMDAAALRGEILGYLEFHIEQGPVLEHLHLPLGIVDGIGGQTRINAIFRGSANHAGTTPMNLRRDALAGAAAWILEVERIGRSVPGLVATVGNLRALPGASNVIAGEAHASLDVRHIDDAHRQQSVKRILAAGQRIACDRHLEFSAETVSERAAVRCDSGLLAELEKAVGSAGFPVHHMSSGAGHDAMILAEKYPVAMLFLRSPGGISHHPDESVLCEDVQAALESGQRFLDQLAALHG